MYWLADIKYLILKKEKWRLKMNSNLDWALNYAKQGFSVVPTNPSNVKIPAIEHAGKPPLTQEEIKQLWTEEPNYGIALKMTNIFSIDVDTPQHAGTTKIDGFKSLKECIPSEWLPDTLNAFTPSGGMHFYYMKVNGLPNKSAAAIIPGVDVQASPNSISVVPPTKRQDGIYEWNLVPGSKNPVAIPPRELIDFIQEKTNQNASKPILFKTFKAKNYAGKLLDALCFQQVKGQRNSYLTSLIGKMLFCGAEEENCYTLAMFANSQFQEPLPEKEVTSIFNSILRKELANEK